MIAWLMGLASISPARLHQLVGKRQVSVIDVNSPASWAKGHVPGAVNLDPRAYSASSLPADKGASIVFYCSGPMCRKAPTAARRAKRLGYSDVKVMSAGIRGWMSARLPTARGS